MSRLRADFLVAASVPLLLAAGLLPWQRDEMCRTVAGCGMVQATAWGGSAGWALPVAAGVVVGGLWVLLLPSRPAPTWLAALTAAVGGLGAVVLIATLDAVVFGRAGVLPLRAAGGRRLPGAVRPARHRTWRSACSGCWRRRWEAG